MSKISAEHLSRQACVYIRQSTPAQVKVSNLVEYFKACAGFQIIFCIGQ